MLEQEPVFPIYASCCVAATDPNNPISWANFTIAEDGETGIRIGSMKISMYQCHDGPLRASLDVPIKSLEDVPSRQQAAKLIEEHWQKIHKENSNKWQTPDPADTNQSKRRKL